MNDKTRRRRDLYKSDFKSEPVEISADWRSTQDPLWLMDNLHLCPVTEVTWESINVETDRRMLAGPLSVLCPVSWNQEDIKAVWFLDSFWWQPLSLPTRLCLLTLSCFGRKNNSRLPLSNDRLDVMYSNMPAEAHFGGRVLWSVAFDATFSSEWIDKQSIQPTNSTGKQLPQRKIKQIYEENGSGYDRDASANLPFPPMASWLDHLVLWRSDPGPVLH